MAADDHDQEEAEALRQRISRLTAAILRISGSLEMDTVLREVVETARALTGSRYGIIITVDAAGEVQDEFYSGITAEERQSLRTWADGPGLFAHFRDLDGAIRLDDLPAYVRSLGLSPDLMLSTTFQGTPMRHRGVHVGNFFLGEKEAGQAFTADDEEMMMLFASQAAVAIANSRAHRDEQRARSDLETLIETSPVGVVVFDAKTGNPRSFNREASRIVDSLRLAGQPPEKLLEVITCHRADGREVTLGDLPLGERFRDPETVRAEEVVLSVPDGRSVRTLVNTTANRAADGAVETVVVTIQDLAPLEDLERSRAEFLGMVSHELRAPLTSIKGSAATVLESVRRVDPEVLQFFRIINEQANQMDGLISDLLDAGRIDAGTLSVSPESSEVGALVDQARNTFLSGGGRHVILIDLPRDLPRVMADRHRIVQVLNNLLSNAARHSPEASPIRIAAERDGVHVAVSVADEGRGVAPELLPRLFQKHTGGDGLAQTGLGLAICKGLVEAHGGRISAASDGPGKGMRVTFTIPAVAAADAPESTPDAGTARPQLRERPRILVVDDDPRTLRFVRDALETGGYAPVVTGDHTDLSAMIATEQPQLVLLDLVLPGTDGLELMETVPELAELPVIFISGYGRGETIARALELGATDYVVKPFSPSELTARVSAALRKRAGTQPFVLGPLTIHYEAHRVSVDGRAVRLTPTEFELLRVLSVNVGRVVPYGSLLRQVWSGRLYADVRTLRTFVRKLRRKLGEDSSKPIWIVNERGVGYCMPRPDGS